MSGLYVPGYGFRSGDEIEINQACKDYDATLCFKRHPVTQHLTIFQRLQRDNLYVKHADDMDLVDGDLFPVRAYPNRIPSVDEVKKWLYESDAQRGDLLEKVERHNKHVKAAQDAEVRGEAHARAVFLEHAFRKNGIDTGVVKSLPNNGNKRR
jgi:hypothetical protein